jgi:hypothetical protein
MGVSRMNLLGLSSSVRIAHIAVTENSSFCAIYCNVYGLRH